MSTQRLHCPYCGEYAESTVADSRTTQHYYIIKGIRVAVPYSDGIVLRRRVCGNCRRRYRAREEVVLSKRERRQGVFTNRSVHK